MSISDQGAGPFLCAQGCLQCVAGVAVSWRKSGVKWCDEGSEGGSCCCPRASAGAFCQLCALSAACWRQWECAAFMCQLGWRPWMLMLVVVPGLAPLDWLAFSLPMCSEGLQCCRTAPWHWHCCLVRLLAGLYESVWMDLLLMARRGCWVGRVGDLSRWWLLVLKALPT